MSLPKLRMWHLIGVIAAVAAFLAIVRIRREANPVQMLIRDLHYGDLAGRLKAADEIREMDLAPHERERVADAFLAALFDRDPRMRAKAAEKLQYWPLDKKTACAATIRDALTQRLHDPDIRARRWAAAALPYWVAAPEAEAVVGPLLDAVKDDDLELRQAAVWALADQSRQNRSAQAAILVAARDSHPPTRVAATAGLYKIARDLAGAHRADPKTVATVAARLEESAADPDQRVRCWAVWGLGELGTSPRALAALLHDPVSDVRERAADKFRRPAAAAVPALIGALSDKEASVRAAAARTLGLLGADAESALPALRAAANDPDAWLRQHVAQQCKVIENASETFRAHDLPEAIASLDDRDAEARRLAAECLGGFGPKAHAAVTALIRRLDDRELKVRRAAARALGDIGASATSALPALEQQAAHDDATIRAAAEAAIKAIRAEIAARPGKT